MSSVTHYDIIIVGAGPAGLSTALHLTQRYPALATRMCVLEAATHPRRKVCGGAITFHASQQLEQLGLQLAVPAATIHRVAFRFGTRTFAVTCRDTMQITQREAFDAALAAAATRAGVEIRSGERVLDLRITPGGVELTTPTRQYRARVVVGADGANSVVRQRIGLRDPYGVARLLRVMTPVDPQQTPEFTDHTAVFDFSCVRAGVQGYLWDFPCLIEGQPYLNRGIFDSRSATGPRGNLKAAFAAGLAQRGVALPEVQLEGHPVRWFNPSAAFAQPHILLVGDAAGVDPLFAEGISYAMEYGAVAADAIGAAFTRQDFSFDSYRSQILAHDLGRTLQLKVALARRLYAHRQRYLWPLIWRCATVAPAAFNQAIGRWLGVLPPTSTGPHHATLEASG